LNPPPRPTCFVVQGFGSKTDYTDGRVLDLDASYDVIKQAVEKAGLSCERADEIVHSGTIDIPMYERLLDADLVIADLSANNLNAAFELGVRYALRPHATLVVAESRFKSPFDVNHIVIRRYEHLGPDLGVKEARRFEKELIAAIRTILADLKTDSPVYALLPRLEPPRQAPAPVPAPASDEAATKLPETPARGRKPAPPPSARDWLERAQQAMAREDYRAAIKAWAEVRRFSPSDRHATQQLALAIYRAKRPSERRALEQARQLLLPLEPATTNDPETLSLWGAIHHRLWERDHEASHWTAAQRTYARALSLSPDHYVAAQLATLHMARAADLARGGSPHSSQADRAIAQRLWREARALAQQQLARKDLGPKSRFWLHVTLWEAAIALDETAEEKRSAARLRHVESAGWMQPFRLAQGELLRGWREALDDRKRDERDRP
jgi:tetratricopeptide (TPR) repeat protein